MIDDGGSAYPVYFQRDGNMILEFPGMSLRDHYAGLAMLREVLSPAPYAPVLQDEEDMAAWAFKQADAMIAEKRKTEKASADPKTDELTGGNPTAHAER